MRHNTENLEAYGILPRSCFTLTKISLLGLTDMQGIEISIKKSKSKTEMLLAYSSGFDQQLYVEIVVDIVLKPQSAASPR